jgi:hypothetical protein
VAAIRTISSVFDQVGQLTELAAIIGNDNFDSGVSLAMQADRLGELAGLAERLSADFEALDRALNLS